MLCLPAQLDGACLLPLGEALVKVRVIRTGLRMTCSLVSEDILHQPFSPLECFVEGEGRGRSSRGPA